MTYKSLRIAGPLAAMVASLIGGTSVASAASSCVTKFAVATSSTEKDAKWYALETTVQAVSWGLWPGFVSTSKVEGYTVSDHYRCSKGGDGYTCHVQATFCKK